MARKAKHPEHANHERWLVSYADFITLLFAFFVVMFATSHADKDKQKVVSAAVKEAINEGSFVTTVAGFLGKSKDNQDIHLREAKPYEGAPNPKSPRRKIRRRRRRKSLWRRLRKKRNPMRRKRRWWSYCPLFRR